MKTTTVVPGPKRMSKGQNPDGRTKKAYEKQYRRAKWPCWKCDNARAAAKREGVEPPGEMSFVSKEMLERHLTTRH